MRRSRNNESDLFGGLAGWLFADVALVLAVAFLSSQVIGNVEPEPPGPEEPPVETTVPEITSTLPQPDQRGSVDVKEIVLSNVCVSDPEAVSKTTKEVELKLIEAGVPASSKFGVALIYAGYREVAPTGDLKDRQEAANNRAKDFRDTLKSWSRLTKERWVKDLGHDQGTDLGCYKLYLLKELKND